MGLFSRREPWSYKCRYCKGPLQHKPGSEFCYCPKCDCEELKSHIIEYWKYRCEEEKKEEEKRLYDNRYSYYTGYAELLEEAKQKGDARPVFLNKNDTSLNPYQYSAKCFDSLSGGCYNYVCQSFSYSDYRNTSYQVIGRFVYDLNKERSSRFHMHFQCKGIFTIYADAKYGNKSYLQALDNHVKNSLTNLFWNNSKKTLNEQLQDRLSMWQRCYYGFDDFDYSNITCDLSLEVTYKYHNYHE